MLLFLILSVVAFYLLTRKDPIKFKQVAWTVYGVLALTFMVGFLIFQRETTTYVFWSQICFLLLLLPIFVLVIREVWNLSHDTPAWVQYTISIPISLLFVLTLWACWNMFPVLIYIF